MVSEPQKHYARKWSERIRPMDRPLGRLRQQVKKTAVSILSAINRRQPGPMLRCIHCHWVFDDQKAQFGDLMASLQEKGTFVDTDTCVEMIAGERPIDRTYFHLSFDDGYRNNFENAAPVLRDLDIPAIFFVPTDFVAADWKTARKYALEITNRSKVLETMTWEELRMLTSWGFDIGSHTRTHARLSELRGERLESELVDSKEELEDRLQTPCDYISWPYGGDADIHQRALDTIREAGYRACFAGVRAAIEPGETDLYRIPRQHFQPHWPKSNVHYFAYQS